MAQQSLGDNNAWKRYTLVMFAFHLCKELQSDKIEIRIGVDCFCYSPACAGVHLDSVRPSFVGLSQYTRSGFAHDIVRLV